MNTFKITNTFTNTTTTEEHESIEQAWRSIEKTIAVQAHEDIANNGLEEDWQDYYPTEYHAHAAHALNFLHFRRQEYEVVELLGKTKTIYIDHNGKQITEEQYLERNEHGEPVIFEAHEMEVQDTYLPLNYFMEEAFNTLHEQLERYEEENGYDHNSPQTKLLNALNNWKSEFGV